MKIALLIILSLFAAGYAHAANVALVVKDANSLSVEHEREVRNLLLELGHTLTYVDKNSVVDYNNFDLIVIAGRPKSSTESLDSFVSSIPVNTKPTVAVDGKFVKDFGWTSGASSIHSTNAQTVQIVSSHPIVSGLSGIVTVHAVTGKPINAISSGEPLSFVATATSLTSKGIVAYANSKTQLLNSQKTKNRIVFFGIMHPLYWTSNTGKMFKQSVTWALGDTDGDGVGNENDLCPNTPSNMEPDSNGCVNMPPSLTFVSPLDGASINEGTAMSIKVDVTDAENNTITYTVKVDGNVVATSIPAEYTWSFNSAGTHTVTVVASDGTNSVEKSVTITVVDAALVPGLKSFKPESASPKEGESLTIKVEAYDDNLLDMKLYKDGNLVKSVNGYLLTYTWRISFDESGSHVFSFNATGDDVSFTDSRTYTVTDVPSVSKDVDSDGVDEFAANADQNGDNGYEFFFDPNGNSNAVAVNGNDDGKTDFVVNGNKYWDPVNNRLTSVTSEDVNNDGTNENVFDTDGDNKPDKIYSGNALVKYPDMTAEISFSNNAPKDGDTVKISAAIKNIGSFGANSFTSELYVDGVLKDSKVLSVAAGATGTMEINYVVSKTHEVKVKVDTTNKIKESNEANNEITKPLSLYTPTESSSSGSSGNSGGAGIIRNAICTITDPEIEVEEGSAYALSFNVKNSGNVFLNNVRPVVSGFPSEWLSITPASDGIIVDRTVTFDMAFDARSDDTFSVSIDLLSDSYSLCKRNFQLIVNPTEQMSQPLVEKTYPEIEITSFDIRQEQGSLILTMKIKNNGAEGSASVGIDVPEGWTKPQEQSISLSSVEEKTITFNTDIPENLQEDASISAYATYDSASGAQTARKDQVLAIEQSLSPLTGLLIGSSSSMFVFITIGSAALFLFTLHKYTNVRRPPWHSSISRYSSGNGRGINPLFLLLLAVPAYFLHPVAGIVIAGAVIAFALRSYSRR